MLSIVRTFVITSLCLSAVACSSFEFPGIYRMKIDQGNIITQQMADELKPGMTRRQVRFVLGTPLVEDTFKPNRWDYINRSRSPEGVETQKRFSVYFNGDILIATSGDWQPSNWPQ